MLMWEETLGPGVSVAHTTDAAWRAVQRVQLDEMLNNVIKQHAAAMPPLCRAAASATQGCSLQHTGDEPRGDTHVGLVQRRAE